MKHYLIESLAPREEHIDPLIVSAETPEGAFALWEYGFPWPCRVNALPPIGVTPQVEKWSGEPSYFPVGTQELEDDDEE